MQMRWVSQVTRYLSDTDEPPDTKIVLQFLEGGTGKWETVEDRSYYIAIDQHGEEL